MTIHRTFTEGEKLALKAHGMPIDRPSMVSDAFVSGLRYNEVTRSEMQEVIKEYIKANIKLNVNHSNSLNGKSVEFTLAISDNTECIATSTFRISLYGGL